MTIITPEIIEIIEALRPDKTMVVGGAVRDFLLGEISADIDIATSATPEVVTTRLQDKLNAQVIPTGLKHGTVTVVYKDHSYEVTTLRQDMSTDGRHAQVEFTRDFKLDASRRDFTFNALYMDENSKITDFFNGEGDLKSGKVRFIGEASARIQEDYLRILRFFRFYGRVSPDPFVDAATKEALRDSAKLLRKLSSERITSELLQILSTPHLLHSWQLLEELQILTHIELGDFALDKLQKLLEIFPEERHELLLLFCLYGDAKRLVKNKWLTFSNQQQKMLKILDKEIHHADLLDNPRQYCYKLGKDVYTWLVQLKAIKQPKALEILQEIKDFEPPKLPVAGADIIAQGIPQGAQVGRILDKVEQWWIKHNFPPREKCLELIAGLVKNIEK